MEMPALRKPKVLAKVELPPERPRKSLPLETNYVILSLKGDEKLVVAADAHNGVISMGEFYKCVFCDSLVRPEKSAKDKHVLSSAHVKILERHPYLNEFSHNLIRKLTDDSKYCIICNVIVANVKLMKHITSEVHLQELERARNRSLTYKPSK